MPCIQEFDVMEVDYHIGLRIYKMKSQYPNPNDRHASIDDANENN